MTTNLTLCSTCGCPIEPDQGRYATADDRTYCLSCGFPFPLGPGVKVTITITGLDNKQGRTIQER